MQCGSLLSSLPLRERRTESVKGACEINILAGGSSSRMGRNKASLRLGRRTLLGHVRACARNSGLPHRVIRRDLLPGCGPLGGVYTALATSRAQIIVFLSCDMPFISADLVKSLLRRMGRRTEALFVTENGRVGFPFLLRRATLPIVERLLARRRLSLQQLASALRARTARLPLRRRHELFNINTREDLQAARKRWRSGLVISQPGKPTKWSADFSPVQSSSSLEPEE